MKFLKTVLNLPWTILGILTAILSIPVRIQLTSEVYIFHVKSFWWLKILPQNFKNFPRACTNGNVILLGPKLDPRDLNHELVHVEQYKKYPFIFPFLYYYEIMKKGYKNNIFVDKIIYDSKMGLLVINN